METDRELNLKAVAAASRAFAESGLDFGLTCDVVARVLSEWVGAYCIVNLLSPCETRFDPVSCAHSDLAKQEELMKVLSQMKISFSGKVWQDVFHGGEPLQIPTFDSELISVFADESFVHCLKDMGLEFLLLAPLFHGDTRVGALILGRDAGEPAYSPDEILLVHELAQRAALAIRNARIFKEQRDALTQLNMALDSAPVGFVLVDLECRYIKVNSALTVPTGRDPSHYVGKTVREMVPQIADTVEEVVNRVVATHQPVLNYEIRVGKYHQVLNSYPVRTSDGHLSGVCSFVVDITDKKELQRDVEMERRRLADFIEQMPGLVWEARVCPESGAFRAKFLSAFVTRVLGYSNEELFSDLDSWLKIVHPDDRESFASARGPGTSLSELSRIEYRCISKDGRVVYMETNAAPIFDGAGNLVGMRGVSIDVSDRKITEIEKSRLTNELQRSLSLRDEFIAVATHELRTPLTALKLQAQLISRIMSHDGWIEKHTEGLKKLLFGVDRQVDSLTRLVNDMLDVRRSANGELMMQFEEVDLLALAGEAMQTISSTHKSIHCSLEVGPDTGYVLRGDRVRLGQVILNLLTNAVRYGSGLPISINLFKKEDKIELAVYDQGIGIAPDDHARIFERYVTVENGGLSGFGLGLYIVREIALAHGGHVLVESKLGEGSCFKLILPRLG